MLHLNKIKISFSIYFIIFNLLFLIPPLHVSEAQNSKKVKASIGQDFSSDCKIFLDDGLSFYTLPFRFSAKDWLYTLAAAGAEGGLMTIDDDVKKSVTGVNGNSSSDVWTIGKNYGEIKYAGTASVLLYAAGLFTRENELRITGRMLIQSLIYSGIITTGIKFVTGRSRPYTTDNQFQFNWFETNEDMLSFPSGHTSVAFAVSAVLAERINTWWARVGFYSLAAATAYSRIYDNKHWLSDVVLGGIVGFASGYFTVHRENQRDKNKSKLAEKFNFNFSLNELNIAYKF
jgi:hypothetical protein